MSAHNWHLARTDKRSLADLCREAVERGETDGPVAVHYDGRLCLTIRSLHAYALLTVAEEPACRLTAWAPHPMATTGPRVQALLDARAAERRLTREYGPCLTRC